MRQFTNALVSIFFHVTLKYFFQGSYCTFSKCGFGLTHCRVNLYFFSFANFYTLSSNFRSLVDPSSCGPIIFVIIVKNARTVSLESCVFIPFASAVLWNRSWQTGSYFKPLLSLTSLSTYPGSIHQISFLNLAKEFNFLNLHSARVKFVYEVFKCRNCLTFHTGRLLALTKLPTDPLSVRP